MPQSCQKSRARDLKVLITTLSLAVTVGGWAVFSQPSATAVANNSNVAVAADQTTSPDNALVATASTDSTSTASTQSTSTSALTVSSSAPAAVAVSRSSR